MSQPSIQPRQREIQEAKQNPESNWRGLYRLSGILLIATAIVWAVVTWTARVLYAGGMPATPDAYLQLVSQNQLLANSTWVLWDVADFLLIAPSVALFLILRRHNKTLALLGAAFQLFFIVYDVSVTELNSLTLVSLSQSYTTATTDALRASYLGAATYGYASLPLQTVLSFAIGIFGFLLWSIPMAKSGAFRRRTATFGAAISIVGLIGSVSPLLASPGIIGLFFFVTLPGFVFWLILVGAQLYRHSNQLAILDGTRPLSQTPSI